MADISAASTTSSVRPSAITMGSVVWLHCWTENKILAKYRKTKLSLSLHIPAKSSAYRPTPVYPKCMCFANNFQQNPFMNYALHPCWFGVFA